MGDQSPVTLNVLAAQIIEQPPTLANHHQKPPPAVVITFVEAKMLSQMVNPLGEQGHLHFGRPGVALAVAELGNDVLCCLHDAQNLKNMGTASV